jgi:hypothetical protein
MSTLRYGAKRATSDANVCTGTAVACAALRGDEERRHRGDHVADEQKLIEAIKPERDQCSTARPSPAPSAVVAVFSRY